LTTSKGTRLSHDERREQLVALGLEMLGRTPYDQVSIESIARAAGISKGLLYHYFPTKTDFVIAVLSRARDELQARMAPDLSVDMPIGERLDAALDAYLEWVDEHAVGFLTVARRPPSAEPEIREAILDRRARRVSQMVGFAAALAQAPREELESPALEVALEGWLWFCEGAVTRWLERGDIDRLALRQLLRANLLAVYASMADVDPRPAVTRLARAADALRTGQLVA
jgi:AcrR family transcriptional regulator